MDITIKTVPAIDTQAWPNEIAVGYLTDAKTLVQKLLDDYKESTVSPQTQQIDEADKARDVRVDQAIQTFGLILTNPSIINVFLLYQPTV